MYKLICTIIILALFTMPAFAQEATPPAELSPELDAQLNNLVAVTEVLRRLDTLTPVTRRFPTREETIAYLTNVYNTDVPPEEWARQQAFYTALGIIPPGVDLRETYLELLGSQVGGFYDPDVETMNVLPFLGDGIADELSITEQIIFVHEYTHALQDQHFGLDMLDDPALAASPDAYLAALALVEGDAAVTMNLYSEAAVLQNPSYAFELLFEGALSGSLILPPGIPDGLEQELIFPYDSGMGFVAELYNEAGSWDLVNEAYTDLPTTTEQILHPEKYLAGEGGQPVDAWDLSAQLDGWTLLYDTTLGEFYLRQYLRGIMSSSLAGQVAAGWGGDRFQLWQNDDTGELAWSLFIAWDTPEDEAEFAELFGEALFASPIQGSASVDNGGITTFASRIDGKSVIVQSPTGVLEASPVP
jgi:hypothetical protein